MDTSEELNPEDPADSVKHHGRVDVLIKLMQENEPKKKSPFEVRVDQLKEYKQIYGNINVPAKYKQNPSLGRWCDNMKQAYKLWIQGKPCGGRLNSDRVQQLEELGFEFTVNKDKSFVQRLDELREYKKKYGDLSIPRSGRGNPSLGKWCADMRTAYTCLHEGKPCATLINEERIKCLDDLGFEWNGKCVTERKIKTFEDRLEDLMRYKEKHGNVNVPRSGKGNSSLGVWCMNMRIAYKAKHEGKPCPIGLTDEREAKLEELGFEWTAAAARCNTFDERIEELREFKEKYGHLHMSKRCKINPSLGQWAESVRKSYKMWKQDKNYKGPLNEERIQKFKDMGFWLGH